MRRIYEPAAYTSPTSCWWWETSAPAALPRMQGDVSTEVAVIGGGFTGLNAGLRLADAGVETVVIDAEQPGWGASTRNGGFCCLGGSKLGGATLAKRYGQAARRDWHATERAAIDHVAQLLDSHGLDAETHSEGETLLAHTPRAMNALRVSVQEVEQSYGVTPTLLDRHALRQAGLNGPFHGAMTTPIGFALNPARYHAGLLHTVRTKGVRVYGQTPANRIAPVAQGWRIATPAGTLTCRKLIIATNGYSSEDIPDWLRGRYLPAQSGIIVTRPLSGAERHAQGWTSRQMCYDTRFLLHYFRLLPDNRFLFGMRGGLRATDRAERVLSRTIRAQFHAMFPRWSDVEITHEWSGLVCLMRSLAPFCGPVPDMPGVFAAMGYHGNGVAMGSYLGAQVADAAIGRTTPLPSFLKAGPKRFPLGPFRRSLLAPAYAVAAMFDL